jgi:hypothetical protein
MSPQREHGANVHQPLELNRQWSCSAICDLNNTFQHCIKMTNQKMNTLAKDKPSKSLQSLLLLTTKKQPDQSRQER